jgi:hypothetical protein
MQDEFEQVEVSARWHFLEEVATDEPDTVAEPADELPFRGVLDNRRKIEQDTGCRRISVEDGGKKRAVSAADIDGGANAPNW